MMMYNVIYYNIYYFIIDDSHVWNVKYGFFKKTRKCYKESEAFFLPRKRRKRNDKISTFLNIKLSELEGFDVFVGPFN